MIVSQNDMNTNMFLSNFVDLIMFEFHCVKFIFFVNLIHCQTV